MIDQYNRGKTRSKQLDIESPNRGSSRSPLHWLCISGYRHGDTEKGTCQIIPEQKYVGRYLPTQSTFTQVGTVTVASRIRIMSTLITTYVVYPGTFPFDLRRHTVQNTNPSLCRHRDSQRQPVYCSGEQDDSFLLRSRRGLNFTPTNQINPCMTPSSSINLKAVEQNSEFRQVYCNTCPSGFGLR